MLLQLFFVALHLSFRAVCYSIGIRIRVSMPLTLLQ